MMYLLRHNTGKMAGMRGFTLVELLVAMAIFVFVITIATGALFSAQAVNGKLEQTQNVLDGVNLSVELLVRDIRYGSNFWCGTGSVPAVVPTTRNSCPSSGGNVLVFRPSIALSGTTDQTQDRVAYYLSNGVLYKSEYPYGVSSRTFQITSGDVKISTLAFFSKGYESSYDTSVDYNQPITTIVLSGTTIPLKITAKPVQFSIQTSASSRVLDK